ncbi:Hpr(ser) kinase [Granulibacter bethesdensis]|nr:Hpr(ser) kinase [Granulibacter bethesdensis]
MNGSVQFRGQRYASCAARPDMDAAFPPSAVLIIGPAGAGKSDLLLRLMDRGFRLVADDRVDICDGLARPPAALAGLIEIRGLGIMVSSYVPVAKLSLVVSLETEERLPSPRRDTDLDLPLIAINPRAASAPCRVEWALECALGRRASRAGAFAREEAV